MTVTVTTGIASETDSALSSTTRGLSGQVYEATATVPSHSPFVYEDIAVPADADEVYLQFDLRFDRYTLDSWNEGNREALLFALNDPDSDTALVELRVKKQQGRFVWHLSTDLGGGDEVFGTHMVAAGTHTIYIHYSNAGGGEAQVTTSLEELSVSA